MHGVLLVCFYCSVESGNFQLMEKQQIVIGRQTVISSVQVKVRKCYSSYCDRSCLITVTKAKVTSAETKGIQSRVI